MSSPGVNIDPRNYRGDMSNDPITYTSDRIKTLNAKIAELPEIFLTDGETSTEFRSNFYRLTTEKGRFLDGVSRLIGGVYSKELLKDPNIE
ncbi:MAG: hypothetical protein Ct9H90mP22_7240 [Gammaproteobacteria bacterium]|nr:MAG: hypothetical protein Ct9H90mP22_7240 [Gammaproteobacteria bacterium]